MKRCAIELETDFGGTYKVEKIHDEDSIQFGDAIEIGELVNNLMKTAGFPCYDKQMVFMESVDEEEADFLFDCLMEYRRGKEEGESDD